MEEVLSFILTKTPIKANSKMEKLMVKEYIPGQTQRFTMETGTVD